MFGREPKTADHTRFWEPVRESAAASPPSAPEESQWKGGIGGGHAAGASAFSGMYDGPTVQRDGDGAAEALASHELVPSGGSALPASVRKKMEQSLGADFSNVRIHSDSSRTRAMGAEAYTVGSDIVFKSGNDDFSSQESQKRLAHELTHVKQQASGPVAGTDLGHGVAMSSPNDAFERDARDAADRAMGGAPPAASVSQPASAPSAASGMTVQRDEDGEGSSPLDKLKDKGLDKLKDKVKDILKEGAKDAAGKPTERLGKVAGPVVEAGAGLINVARADGPVDRVLAAEKAFKSTSGAIGSALGGKAGKKGAEWLAQKGIDYKRKAAPFQGEVKGAEADDPEFEVKGELNGDGTTINRNLQGEGVGDINRGDETVKPDGTRIDNASGQAINANEGAPSENAPLDPETKKYLDKAFDEGKAKDEQDK